MCISISVTKLYKGKTTPKELAAFFYPPECEEWEDFELEVCELKKRSVNLLPVLQQEAQKHKIVNVEERECLCNV